MSNDDSQDIYETPSTSPSFKTELAAQLSELIPEAIADGKVDVEKLKELLGDDAGDDRERFGLFWPGKKRALRAAQEPTTATLKPDVGNSKDWDTTRNVFVEGDNLEVLKILQKHYHGQINMIYIDPPYNTGKDFVYPDNFKEGLETYLEWTRQVNEEGKRVSTNSESEGRYHSNWLNMMYPRLKLARNLLTEDGVIFISIDDNEVANLRRLSDEIFGEANFIDCIVWKKRYGGGPKEKHFVTVHEYVLVYARNIINIPNLGCPTSERQVSQYYKLTDDFVAERGPYRLHPLEAVKSMDARPNLVYDIPAPDGTEISPKRQWIWSKDRVEQSLAEGRLEFLRDKQGEWAVHTKQYLYDESGEVRKTKALSLIDNIYTQHGTNEIVDLLGSAKVFPFPKPSAFVKRLIEMADRGKDAVVMDFFAGSATTADAVMQLNAEDGGNRTYILVQLPEPVPVGSEAEGAEFATIADIARHRVDVSAARISAGLEGQMVLRETPLDLGYRAFKLGDTNFSKWHIMSDVEPTALEQHILDLRDSAEDEASPDALLTEILLKQGYSLTEQIGDTELSGLKFKTVDGGRVLAYLDERTKPTLEQLRVVVAEKPGRFIILEDAFQGDDELKTNLAQECKSRGVELWTA